MLDVEQRGTDVVRQIFAEQKAEAGVEFVDFANGVDAQAVLGRAAAVRADYTEQPANRLSF